MVLSDPTLGDEVHNGKKQEGFVWCAMAGDLRIPVSTPVGPKISEHLEVFIKHCIPQPLPSYYSLV